MSGQLIEDGPRLHGRDRALRSEPAENRGDTLHGRLDALELRLSPDIRPHRGEIARQVIARGQSQRARTEDAFAIELASAPQHFGEAPVVVDGSDQPASAAERVDLALPPR